MVGSTAGQEGSVERPWGGKEDHVGFDRVDEGDRGDCLKPCSEALGGGIGRLGKGEPEIILEIGQHLGREIAVFGGEMTGTLATKLEGISRGGIKKDDRLHAEETIFGPAESQDIDA